VRLSRRYSNSFSTDWQSNERVKWNCGIENECIWFIPCVWL